jgi:isoprenylcysteine carboxyl methyltransferase (ICMT) family protein YpbQ
MWRIYTLRVSKRNERVLEAAGAREYGSVNSSILQGLHGAYYLAVFLEGYWRGTEFGETTLWGAGLYLFSVVMLLIVWHNLKELWTVKLYIASDHEVVRSRLFRLVRHPNYFLSIIPELVGLALALEAWYVLTIGFPLYAVSLIVRVVQEERVMRDETDYF